MKICINNWVISQCDIGEINAIVPCTVLSTLVDKKTIFHPYINAEEEIRKDYLKKDYVFTSHFELNCEQLNNFNYLTLDRILTVAEVFINGEKICFLNNFHLKKIILIDKKTLREKNEIVIKFQSPYTYIENYPNPRGMFKLFMDECDPNAPKLRQPAYTFGWDWAPNLADIGIIGEVSITSTKEGYLDSYRYEYDFCDNGEMKVNVSTNFVKLGDSPISIYISCENKVIAQETQQLKDHNEFSLLIKNPKLWYPRGLGEQALYTLKIKTNENTYSYKIGFKIIRFDFKRTNKGRNFGVYINDINMFLKGFDMVPEDSILPWVTEERTNKILNLCANTNANAIRQWGGGYYPSDYFYQRCDELGLLVWQDLMFSVASYDGFDEDFMKVTKEEVTQQIKRIRNHPSLLLICGNNENETAICGKQETYGESYKKMFLEEFAKIAKNETNTLYLHSSPTNLDNIFIRSNDPDTFDVHYWNVGNGNSTYDDYDSILPPMLSEFGLWSMQNYQTNKQYLGEKELYLYSNGLKTRNKREGNFERTKINIEFQNRFNDDFRTYTYLTQLFQARGLKYCIEHLRNNQSICHGGIFWQLNDCWPGISCSVIDYNYGLKGAYYYAKRVFNDELVTISHKDGVIRLHVSNLLNKNKEYKLIYRYMTFEGQIKDEILFDVESEKESSQSVIVFDSPLKNEDEFLFVELQNNDGKIISQNYFQAKLDKDINYPKSNLDIKKLGPNTFSVKADVFTKDICLYKEDEEIDFSDNFFTLKRGDEVIITTDKDLELKDLKYHCVNNL